MGKFAIRNIFAAALPFSLLAPISCSSAYQAPQPSPAQETAIVAAVADVSKAELLACLQSIDFVRDLYETGNTGVATSEANLVSRLSGYGYAVAKTESGKAGTWIDPMDTLIADKPGRNASLPWVFVMAHWDSYGPGHGMDDNGSGTAAVVETARVLASRNFDRGIRFLLFGNEERNIDGSDEYVASLRDSELPCFFVNFEMIGYTTASPDKISALVGQSSGDWIGVYAPDWGAGGLADFARCSRAYVQSLKFSATSVPADFKKIPLLSMIGLSDNLYFWNRGAAGLMLSDGQLLRNPYYHTVDDSLDKINLDFMTNVVKASLATICLKAGIVAP